MKINEACFLFSSKTNNKQQTNKQQKGTTHGFELLACLQSADGARRTQLLHRREIPTQASQQPQLAIGLEKPFLSARGDAALTRQFNCVDFQNEK